MRWPAPPPTLHPRLSTNALDDNNIRGDDDWHDTDDDDCDDPFHDPWREYFLAKADTAR